MNKSINKVFFVFYSLLISLHPYMSTQCCIYILVSIYIKYIIKFNISSYFTCRLDFDIANVFYAIFINVITVWRQQLRILFNGWFLAAVCIASKDLFNQCFTLNFNFLYKYVFQYAFYM